MLTNFFATFCSQVNIAYYFVSLSVVCDAVTHGACQVFYTDATAIFSLHVNISLRFVSRSVVNINAMLLGRCARPKFYTDVIEVILSSHADISS